MWQKVRKTQKVSTFLLPSNDPRLETFILPLLGKVLAVDAHYFEKAGDQKFNGKYHLSSRSSVTVVLDQRIRNRNLPTEVLWVNRQKYGGFKTSFGIFQSENSPFPFVFDISVFDL